MSVVDDSRKVLQDLIAPDLQAIKAELKAVDERSKLRDEALAAKIDNIGEKSKLRDEALSDKIDFKFELLVSKIESLAALLSLDRRMEAIERKGPSGPTLHKRRLGWQG